MTRCKAGVLLAAAGLAMAPLSAEASVLCVAKKGALIVRSERCKAKETVLDPGAAGLRGPQGPGGPPGSPGPPGPAGLPGTETGLRVVDAVGGEVGAVISVGYGAVAVARQVRVGTPDGPLDEWVILQVSGAGFRQTASPSSFVYLTENCAGTRYLQSYYGSIAPDELAHSVASDLATNTGFYARGAELLKPQTYFGMRTVFDFSADQAVQDCTASGGQVVGAAEPCPEGVGPPGFFCVGCCQQAGSQSSAAPVHTLKLSDLGTPPFKLQR